MVELSCSEFMTGSKIFLPHILQLLDDKKTLTEQCEKLVKEQRISEKKNADKVFQEMNIKYFEKETRVEYMENDSCRVKFGIVTIDNSFCRSS